MQLCCAGGCILQFTIKRSLAKITKMQGDYRKTIANLFSPTPDANQTGSGLCHYGLAVNSYLVSTLTTEPCKGGLATFLLLARGVVWGADATGESMKG